MRTALIVILLAISLLHAIHISENTIWGPENNPYIITENVYIHANVTLTILPGTEIQVTSMPSNNYYYFRWIEGEEADTKMFLVFGNINAIGDEDNPVRFTPYPDDAGYYWGGIHVFESSNSAVFRNCEFHNAYRNFCEDVFDSHGALSFDNQTVRVEECDFLNCWYGVHAHNPVEDVFIHGCSFSATDEPNFSEIDYFTAVEVINEQTEGDPLVVMFGSNRFEHITEVYEWGSPHVDIHTYYINNKFINQSEYSRNDSPRDIRRTFKYYHYGNIYDRWCDVIYVSRGLNDPFGVFHKNEIHGDSLNESSTVVRTSGYVHVLNNLFDGYAVLSDYYGDSTYVANNIFRNNTEYPCIYFDNPSRIVNNLFIETDYMKFNFCPATIMNNLIIHSTQKCLPLLYEGSFVGNNILLSGDEIISNACNVVFSNNFMNHELPEHTIPINNLIGNDPMFADTLNGDYSLAEGSPCIDTGMTEGDFPPTDILGNVRVWDGDEDGSATIDIGAFEYGAPFWGGIEGYVYQSDGVTPLDIAKITVDGMPLPEWSDSTGWFRILTGPGTFTLNIERFYYDDQQITGIVVEQGSPTYQNVTMHGLATEDYDNHIQKYTITMDQNTPNPFNPTTTISYSIPKDDKVVLKVYNIKGQLVKTLVNDHLEAGTHNAIWNGNDETEKRVSSGVYLYRLESGGRAIVKKMLLLK